MTRFQISVITSKSIWTSIEFNGEGYWTGYGKEVFNTLKDEVNTVADWKKYVGEVNDHYFNYNEKLHYCISGNKKEDLLDMTSNYFDKWFSDYLYIKNLSKKEVEFITSGGSTVLAPNEVAIFNFGTRVKPNDEGKWDLCNTDEIEDSEMSDDERICATQAYEKFKFQWMFAHNFTLKDLWNAAKENDGIEIFEEWEMDIGFNSEIYPCFNEFLDVEWNEMKEGYGF